jgi:hypothetical protein
LVVVSVVAAENTDDVLQGSAPISPQAIAEIQLLLVQYLTDPDTEIEVYELE